MIDVDIWNGSLIQVQGFIDVTGTTFPVLRDAGFLSQPAYYGINYENYVVIDAEGIVRYVSRTVQGGRGGWQEAAVRAASAIPDARDGVVFLRGVDVGVYRVHDLLAQPARPGTLDLREHHRWLYGDRSILDALAPAANRRIAATEALYLLENRAWDVLGAAATGAGAFDAERSRVQAAKAILDVGAAHLIAEGRFVRDRQHHHVASLLALAHAPVPGTRRRGLGKCLEVAVDVLGVGQLPRRSDDAPVELERGRDRGGRRQMIDELRRDARVLEMFLDLGSVRRVDRLLGSGGNGGERHAGEREAGGTEHPAS